MGIISAVFAFIFLVVLHEVGHFLAARIFRVVVLQFSIGFGPALFSFTFREVLYVIRIFPLGGYVRLLATQSTRSAFSSSASVSVDKALDQVHPAAALFISIAGSLTNFLMAFIILLFVFYVDYAVFPAWVGEVQPQSPAYEAGVRKDMLLLKVGTEPITDLSEAYQAIDSAIMQEKSSLAFSFRDNFRESIVDTELPLNLSSVKEAAVLSETLGFTLTIPPIVARVLPNSLAEKAGFLPLDRIISVENEPILDWKQFLDSLQSNLSSVQQIKILRHGEMMTLLLDRREEENIGKLHAFIGVLPIHMVKFPDIYLSAYSAVLFIEHEVKFFVSVIEGIFEDGLHFSTFHGPIDIFLSAAYVADFGFKAYFEWLAILSVFLGLLNLLPFPSLDGYYVLRFVFAWLLLSCESIRHSFRFL